MPDPTAQRRPERQPRLHEYDITSDAYSYAAQRSRSVNPGYTIVDATLTGAQTVAQRRPERQPRLHC